MRNIDNTKSETNGLRCPSCGSTSVDRIGDIPPSDRFAGRVLIKSIEGGELCACKVCSLRYRFPILSKFEMDSLYREGDDKSWSFVSGNTRKDWVIATNWVNEKLPIKRKVLDVGCFDGGFLSELKNKFELYGIEIHSGAAKVASQRGVSILGNDFEEMECNGLQFDMVVAFDVIEHINDPMAFLKKLSALVNPGGYLVLSTGNSDAISWRLMKGRYWYCAMSEHIRFINPAWCNFVASKCNLSIIKMKKFSHMNAEDLTAKIRAKQVVLNMTYLLLPRLFSYLRLKGLSSKDVLSKPEMAFYPPSWMSAKDHFITLFKKG